MKKLALICLVFTVAAPAFAQRPKPKAKPTLAATPTPSPSPTPVIDQAELDKQELDAFAQLPPPERVDKLKDFIARRADSALSARAAEDVVRARAVWGDDLLKEGSADAGLDQFELVLKECPKEFSDRLFAEVLLVLPRNLLARGQRTAATLAAQEVEKLARPNPTRLLALLPFYLSVEDAVNAERLALEIVQLAPDSAAGHQALGAARHINLNLDEALAEYRKAYELDPNSPIIRRSLADMLRAVGQAEDAIALYRKQLETDKDDLVARTGLVLALLEAGQREEGEKELDAAMAAEPRNFRLLASAAYWHAARGENAKALDLAQRAVQLEPRYTWGNIALARALAAQQRPFEAERVLRFAQQYGSFPTLTYELATVLAGMGRYDEAAEELARAFKVKGGQVSALLAGRRETYRDGFAELLAPERRAGLLQPVAADTEANARQLKSLLALYTALRPTDGDKRRDETAAARAARDFGGGADGMATYRQLYAAHRLMNAGWSPQIVGQLMNDAPVGVDAALDQPYAVVAIMADDWLRLSQSGAFANLQPTMNQTQRADLSKVIRGRIEDLAGWSFFLQGNTDEALVRFRRALSVLPENTSWWRSAHWHHGAALEAAGKPDEALAAYLKGYNKNAPDLVRRAVIERLYRQVKGTTEGLDALIGAAPTIAGVAPAPAPEAAPSPAETKPAPGVQIITPTPEPTPEATPETTATPAPAAESSPATKTEPTPEATPAPQTEPTPAPQVEATPERAPTPESPTPSPSPEVVPAATPSPEPTPAAEPTPTPKIDEPKPDVTPAPETTPNPPQPEASPETSPTPAPEAAATPQPSPETTPQPSASPEPTPAPAEEKPAPTEEKTAPTPEGRPADTNPPAGEETKPKTPPEPKRTKRGNNEPAEPETPPAGAVRPRRVTPLPEEKPAPDKNKPPDKPKKPDTPQT
jgi:tetratricopeptide (TPR) repeat protein